MNEKEILYSSLFIFGIGSGKDGQSTLKFENITEFAIEEGITSKTLIRFKYKSASTGEIRKAEFIMDNISGYSLTPVD